MGPRRAATRDRVVALRERTASDLPGWSDCRRCAGPSAPGRSSRWPAGFVTRPASRSARAPRPRTARTSRPRRRWCRPAARRRARSGCAHPVTPARRPGTCRVAAARIADSASRAGLVRAGVALVGQIARREALAGQAAQHRVVVDAVAGLPVVRGERGPDCRVVGQVAELAAAGARASGTTAMWASR